jgi:ribosome-binding protein aMBF1 (putative translation factor)
MKIHHLIIYAIALHYFKSPLWGWILCGCICLLYSIGHQIIKFKTREKMSDPVKKANWDKKMKKNPRLEARRKKISKDIDIFVEKSFDIADRIHDILKNKGIDQKEFAKRLGKSESEISKWMTGTHNFTFLTISLIESVLEEDICIIAGKEKNKTN